VFGFFFGSVFGKEDIIKPILFHPMENINTVLLGGVAIGVLFTTISFIYSLFNAVKRKDIEEGIFGKNGLAGIMFYWIILLTALSIYNQNGTVVPIPLIVAVLCILLGFTVVKHPAANLVKGQRPLYSESMRDYYIESGFGAFETLSSMVSNTISFIRVGAFALNHVGLFIAFLTIADMIKGGVGGVIVLIIGNIIVICLEGMVVFIQGLRLEYYELFSKYYTGSGIEYNPVKIRYISEPEAQAVTVKSENNAEIVMEKAY
jgi:V/A-type H+-transporting ATPase subunit I